MTAPDPIIPPSTLLDRELIRELKFDYCDGLDRADVDALVPLFTPDALYDIGKFGSYQGHDAIRELLTGLLATFTLTSHTPTIGKIRVDGDRASAHWKALVAMEPKSFDTAQAATRSLAFIDYHDVMVRQDSRWLFSEVRLNFRGEWAVDS